MRNNNDAYMIFVLGYDLLQEELTSFDGCPCDLAYEACIDIYNEFLASKESNQNKSEYECLQDWINTHQEKIDYIIKLNFNLIKNKKETIELLKDKNGNLWYHDDYDETTKKHTVMVVEEDKGYYINTNIAWYMNDEEINECQIIKVILF
jgi:hypothetical protein